MCKILILKKNLRIIQFLHSHIYFCIVNEINILFKKQDITVFVFIVNLTSSTS